MKRTGLPASAVKTAMHLAALILVAALMVLPLYWMFTSAFKTDAEITRRTPTLWPEKWVWGNFSETWSSFVRPCLNSLVVSAVCTGLIVLLSTLAGYALAKKRFLGRGAFFTILVGTMLIPPSVLIVPLYCVISAIGLADTLTGLVLPFAVTAFGIFLMRQFAAEIPDSLLESARVDGWGEAMIFWRVVLPLLKPAMAVLAIIEFVNNWNSFAVPFVLISSPEKRTLQLALADLRMAYEITPWSQVMAASVITVLPILVLFLFFQRGIIRHIMRGAIKG